jgi:hypothetical protein
VGFEEIHRGFWYEEVKGRNQLEDHGVNGRIMLKLILNLQDGNFMFC